MLLSTTTSSVTGKIASMAHNVFHDNALLNTVKDFLGLGDEPTMAPATEERATTQQQGLGTAIPYKLPQPLAQPSSTNTETSQPKQ